MAGAGFSNIPGIDENVVYIIKNPRNFTKVTLGTYKIKNILKYQLFTNAYIEVNSTIVGCNIVMISIKFN